MVATMTITFDTDARSDLGGTGTATARNPSSEPKPGREAWMDVLRGGAMVLVLALHATLMVEWYQLEPWPALAEYELAPVSTGHLGIAMEA